MPDEPSEATESPPEASEGTQGLGVWRGPPLRPQEPLEWAEEPEHRVVSPEEFLELVATDIEERSREDG